MPNHIERQIQQTEQEIWVPSSGCWILPHPPPTQSFFAFCGGEQLETFKLYDTQISKD